MGAAAPVVIVGGRSSNARTERPLFGERPAGASFCGRLRAQFAMTPLVARLAEPRHCERLGVIVVMSLGFLRAAPFTWVPRDLPRRERAFDGLLRSAFLWVVSVPGPAASLRRRDIVKRRPAPLSRHHGRLVSVIPRCLAFALARNADPATITAGSPMLLRSATHAANWNRARRGKPSLCAVRRNSCRAHWGPPSFASRMMAMHGAAGLIRASSVRPQPTQRPAQNRAASQVDRGRRSAAEPQSQAIRTRAITTTSLHPRRAVA
jgi:hypothetical protein